MNPLAADPQAVLAARHLFWNLDLNLIQVLADSHIHSLSTCRHGVGLKDRCFEPICLVVMGRTVSLVHSTDQIRLAGASPPAGFLHRRGRRLWEMTHRRRVTAGALLATEEALVLDAQAVFPGKLEVPWDAIRKVVVDDGTRWGYVSAVCRFPVYDVRPDGSGSGVLIGPLWSTGSSLMPPACPVAPLDPVPGQAPNIALIFESVVSGPAAREQTGNGARESDFVVGLLLRVDDPAAAREALGARIKVGDVDHDDLEYLARAGHSAPGNGASSNGNSRNGASSNGTRGNGASAASA